MIGSKSKSKNLEICTTENNKKTFDFSKVIFSRKSISPIGQFICYSQEILSSETPKYYNLTATGNQSWGRISKLNYEGLSQDSVKIVASPSIELSWIFAEIMARQDWWYIDDTITRLVTWMGDCLTDTTQAITLTIHCGLITTLSRRKSLSKYCTVPRSSRNLMACFTW